MIPGDDGTIQMRLEVKRAEQIFAKLAHKCYTRWGKIFSEPLARELLASAAALFAARTIAILHVWTGESLDKIRRRFYETVDENLKGATQKILEEFKRTEAPK